MTARISPSVLSIWENSTCGMLSASGCRWHTISPGMASNGGRVRAFFGGVAGCGGSDRLRLTRSCDSGVRLIGDFQAAV